MTHVREKRLKPGKSWVESTNAVGLRRGKHGQSKCCSLLYC